jgi:hypothetical protein
MLIKWSCTVMIAMANIITIDIGIIFYFSFPSDLFCLLLPLL